MDYLLSEPPLVQFAASYYSQTIKINLKHIIFCIRYFGICFSFLSGSPFSSYINSGKPPPTTSFYSSVSLGLPETMLLFLPSLLPSHVPSYLISIMYRSRVNLDLRGPTIKWFPANLTTRRSRKKLLGEACRS